MDSSLLGKAAPGSIYTITHTHAWSIVHIFFARTVRPGAGVAYVCLYDTTTTLSIFSFASFSKRAGTRLSLSDHTGSFYVRGVL